MVKVKYEVVSMVAPMIAKVAVTNITKESTKALKAEIESGIDVFLRKLSPKNEFRAIVIKWKIILIVDKIINIIPKESKLFSAHSSRIGSKSTSISRFRNNPDRK